MMYATEVDCVKNANVLHLKAPYNQLYINSNATIQAVHVIKDTACTPKGTKFITISRRHVS